MDNTHAKLIADAISDHEFTMRSLDDMSKAINHLAEAIKGFGEKISQDEPLNYTLARSLDRIANGILYQDEGC